MNRYVILVIATLAGLVALPAMAQMSFYDAGPLHRAAGQGDIALMHSLVVQGHAIDEPYDDRRFQLEGNSTAIRGLTPLMVAAAAGRFDAVKWLVDRGAQVNAESNWADRSYPRNVFDYAIDGGSAPTADYIWQHGDKTRMAARMVDHFVYACRSFCNDRYGTDEARNLALLIAARFRDPRGLGEGIGRVAASSRGLANLQFLEARGLKFPRNTLGYVARYNVNQPWGAIDESSRVAIIRFLLEHGADPNDLPPDEYAATPVISAAAAHDVAVLRLLVQAGGRVDLVSRRGRTAVASAANTCTFLPPKPDPVMLAHVTSRESAQLATIEFLLKSGAKPEVPRDLQPFGKCCADPRHSPGYDRICRMLVAR
jgi:hypothetical protein